MEGLLHISKKFSHHIHLAIFALQTNFIELSLKQTLPTAFVLFLYPHPHSGTLFLYIFELQRLWTFSKLCLKPTYSKFLMIDFLSVFNHLFLPTCLCNSAFLCNIPLFLSKLHNLYFCVVTSFVCFMRLGISLVLDRWCF